MIRKPVGRFNAGMGISGMLQRFQRSSPLHSTAVSGKIATNMCGFEAVNNMGSGKLFLIDNGDRYPLTCVMD